MVATACDTPRANPQRSRVPRASLAVPGRRGQYGWYGPGEPGAASDEPAPSEPDDCFDFGPGGSRCRRGARVSVILEPLQLGALRVKNRIFRSSLGGRW